MSTFPSYILFSLVFLHTHVVPSNTRIEYQYKFQYWRQVAIECVSIDQKAIIITTSNTSKIPKLQNISVFDLWFSTPENIRDLLAIIIGREKEIARPIGKRVSCFLNTQNINRLLILLTVFRGYLVQVRSGERRRVYVPTGASRITRGIVFEHSALWFLFHN